MLLGNRGNVCVDVSIRGKGGHAGLPHALHSPIDAAIESLAQLRDMPLPAVDDRFDPPRPSLTVTSITAPSSARNVVPDRASCTIDRRLLPGEETTDAITDIERVLARTCSPPLEVTTRVVREWPPYTLERDEPIAKVAAAAATAAGRPPRLGMDNASNDSSWLVKAGIPTVLLGPGEPEQRTSRTRASTRPICRRPSRSTLISCSARAPSIDPAVGEVSARSAAGSGCAT